MNIRLVEDKPREHTRNVEVYKHRYYSLIFNILNLQYTYLYNLIVERNCRGFLEKKNEDLCVTAEVLVKTITLLLTTKLTDLE